MVHAQNTAINQLLYACQDYVCAQKWALMGAREAPINGLWAEGLGPFVGYLEVYPIQCTVNYSCLRPITTHKNEAFDPYTNGDISMFLDGLQVQFFICTRMAVSPYFWTVYNCQNEVFDPIQSEMRYLHWHLQTTRKHGDI